MKSLTHKKGIERVAGAGPVQGQDEDWKWTRGYAAVGVWDEPRGRKYGGVFGADKCK
jgi:hypothetical protein